MLKLSINALGNARLLHLISGRLERMGIQLCGIWCQGEEPKPSIDAFLEADVLLHCGFMSRTRWSMWGVERLRRDFQPGEKQYIIQAMLFALTPLRIKRPESIVNIRAAMGADAILNGKLLSEFSEDIQQDLWDRILEAREEVRAGIW